MAETGTIRPEPGPPGTTSPGFGVYVHWPFCAAKCPYCDFNSHVRHQAVDQQAFASAMVRELTTMAERAPGRLVTSVFFGGGTPSLMQPATVAAVLDAISGLWPVASGAEITLEANPSSVEAERFAGYRAAGVNRLSLGVQALNDPDLKALGRLHDVETAIKAIELARSTFDRLSFDLIYARPHQEPDNWAAELARAIDLAADHLSLYQLTIEDGTPFKTLHDTGKLRVPDADLAARFYEVTQSICEQAGLPAYEISNHARPGAESRHNLTYWRYGEYAGVGPGAHGRLGDGHARHAIATERHPETWLKKVGETGSGVIVDEVLTREEEGDELLLMGLRLGEGVDLDRFRFVSGRTIDPARVEDLVGHGLIERLGGSRVRVSSDGWLVLDAVVADLAA